MKPEKDVYRQTSTYSSLHINLPEWCFKRLVMTLTNVSGQINYCHHP